MSELDSIIDLRSFSEFRQGHFCHATHLPWPELKCRLNELPASPACLRLMGQELDCIQAQAFLAEKGYQVLIEVSWQAKLAQKQPGLVVFDGVSRPLWQPSPLVKEFVEGLQKTFDSTSLKAIDLGCGGGRDAVYLALNGFDVTAIEHKPAVLERAEQLATSSKVSIDFRACDLASKECFSDIPLWDLMVCVRFLNRALFTRMCNAIKPGGWIVFQTFSAGCEDFGSPKNPNFILKPHELSKVFADFIILIDRIDKLPDGRPVASFIAQKKG